jgi:hypothetical protein
VFSSFRIYSSVFPGSNTISLYRSERQLYFNLDTGRVYDGDDNYYTTSTVTKNSVIYVSVPFVCNFFGLSWSYIDGIGYGDILRITDGRNSLSNAEFLNAAASIMQPRYESYIASLTPKTTPSPSPAATASAVPSPAPTSGTEPVYPVYLSFEGLPGSALLDTLDRYGVHAAFYLTAEDIAASPDTVRRLYGSGHSIGLWCTDSGSQEEASALLRDAAQTCTVLISASGDGLNACRALAEETGLHFSGYELDVRGLTATQIMSWITAARRTVHVRLDCSDTTERNLSALLSSLNTNKYDLLLEREV